MVANLGFEFTDKNFDLISHFVFKHTGIVLSSKKKSMVYSRLVKRVRHGDFACFQELCDALEAGDQAEQDFVINAITTNLTAFFRESYHFDYLAKTVIPELVEKNKKSKRLRIWSAGCSTGEEPYSIAMILKENLSNIDEWDIKILASDLDANVIETGKNGIYHADRITGIPEGLLHQWFKRGRGDKNTFLKVSSELQDFIRFRRLNLLHEWPMKGEFDIIFCRNVMIYFDKDTQRNLSERYANILSDEGYLFLGHSESLYNVSDQFRALGQTIYKKKVE